MEVLSARATGLVLFITCFGMTLPLVFDREGGGEKRGIKWWSVSFVFGFCGV